MASASVEGVMCAAAGAGFGAGGEYTVDVDARTGTGAAGPAADRTLEQNISMLLEMSYEQIVEWAAGSEADSGAAPGDDEDEDPDGFDPDADSEADDDRGADEPAEDGSEWDLLEVSTGNVRREADVVLRPGEPEGSWVAVLARPAAMPGAEVPAVVLAALQGRDRTVLLVAQTLVDQQREYLESGDPADLRALKQKEVAELASAAGFKLSEQRVSRTLAASRLELPDGQVVPLETLVVNSDVAIARAIQRAFVEHDQVTRASDGSVLRVGDLIAWTEVVRIVQREEKAAFNRGLKEGNLRRTAKKFVLPVNVDIRRRAYWEGNDWWTASF